VRVLFDTDVVLDLLLDRQPFSEAAASLFSLVECGRIEGYLCATTVTTVHYLAGRAQNARAARQHLELLLSFLRVAAVDHDVLAAALGSRITDYEDAVLHEAAAAAGVQAIVTRNVRDFRRAAIPVYSPDELCRVLEATG